MDLHSGGTLVSFKKKIADCCLDGVVKAAKEYGKWSGGVSLRSAPESITHIFVAESLAKELSEGREGSKIISLEEKPMDLIRTSVPSTKATKGKRIERGRIDITVWKKGNPWLVVEVKRHSSRRSINEDVKRIRKLFNCPSIKAGFVVVVTQAKKKGVVEDRFDKMAEESNTQKGGGIRYLNGETKKGNPMYVGAMCFVVNPGENTP
jgi:hypothetical protein